MLPALRLLLLTLGVLLISSSAAQAATKSLTLPAEGQVAVTFASAVKSVKVKSAPAGVTVAGGVKGGRLAVAVVRPRGVTAAGKVTLTLKGKPKGVKTVAAALDGGKASSCAGLDKLLAKRLAGKADVKALADVLAAQLCGRAAPANAAAILAQLGLGAPPAPPVPSPGPAAPAPGGQVNAPAKPVATPTPGAGRACANGTDDDKDGQVDAEDPGCADSADTSETGEVDVPAECVENNSGVGMGDSTTGLSAGINDCGPFTKVRVDAAPGVAACDVFTGGPGWTCAHAGGYGVATGPAVTMADLNLTLTGPANCTRKVTIALYRPGGEVAELYVPIARCKTGGAEPEPPACANGKDDDGDGMVDDHFADGALDPDPGCTSTTDTSESSEVLAPASCKIELGLWNDAGDIAGATADGCGGLRGFWYRAPGTVTECGHRFGAGALLDCQKVRETGGTMFDGLVFDKLSVYTALEQPADCRPMTLTLIREDFSVWFYRAKLEGC